MLVKVLVLCSLSLTAASASPIERQVRADPLLVDPLMLDTDPILDNWETEEAMADLLIDKIEASKTSLPTMNPTTSPSDMPSTSPSEYPTLYPSSSPSAVPSIAPSTTQYPSSSPTVSVHPSAFPTSTPSMLPSSAPSISSEPTSSPSSQPSLSSSPSSQPSLSMSPTESPTVSVSPTMEAVVVVSLDQSNRKTSTQLLIFGACVMIAIASTGAILYKRGSIGIKRKRLPLQIEADMADASTPQHVNGGMMSPSSSNLKLNQMASTFDTSNSDSEFHVVSLETDNYTYAAAGKKLIKHSDELVDIDLENGTEGAVMFMAGTDAGTLLTQSSTMPKSIYIPKFFQRWKGEVNTNNTSLSWNQIRDNNRSPASSGCAPTSLPSPMLSPFLVKGFSSRYAGFGKQQGGNLMDDSSSHEEEGDLIDDVKEKYFGKQPRKRKKGIKVRVKEFDINKETPSPGSDIFADLDNALAQEENGEADATVPASSAEWGFDAAKKQATFETNINELQNLLHTIESMGSNEAKVNRTPPESPKIEVEVTYSEDSWETDGTFLGNIAPIDSSSTYTASEVITPRHGQSKTNNGSGITFKRELLSANRRNGEGISFRNIFNDPKNDLYETYVPSGPLGIVVDTTPLGPRVRSLNPLSSLFGKICPGDVIVGVDDIDSVGMEAGEFWQIVSRKANQQERVLTMLRI